MSSGTQSPDARQSSVTLSSPSGSQTTTPTPTTAAAVLRPKPSSSSRSTSSSAATTPTSTSISPSPQVSAVNPQVAALVQRASHKRYSLTTTAAITSLLPPGIATQQYRHSMDVGDLTLTTVAGSSSATTAVVSSSRLMSSVGEASSPSSSSSSSKPKVSKVGLLLDVHRLCYVRTMV